MRALQESGVTFLYISHHLEEIYEICKTVTVMRDGRVVADASLDDLPKDMLVGAMVGEAAMSTRSADHRDRRAAPENAGGLEISGLTVAGHVDAINLNIRRGECVGLAGLAGSGKDHVAEVVAGLLIPASGEVSIDGVRAPEETWRRYARPASDSSRATVTARPSRCFRSPSSTDLGLSALCRLRVGRPRLTKRSARSESSPKAVNSRSVSPAAGISRRRSWRAH
jgi:ABC-type uncharacterized transport system ATPase subunit